MTLSRPFGVKLGPNLLFMNPRRMASLAMPSSALEKFSRILSMKAVSPEAM